MSKSEVEFSFSMKMFVIWEKNVSFQLYTSIYYHGRFVSVNNITRKLRTEY